MKPIICALILFSASASNFVRAEEKPAGTPQRYTFSWPLTESAPAPRGGTTRGAPVTLDTSPSQAWQSLRAEKITHLERDRRAILALAGDYRVSFDFLEVASFGNDPRQTPYQSWGSERVYVDRDEPHVISLVHILEMRIIQKDGSVSEPLVTKHWREDWHFEPRDLVEFKCHDVWRRREVAAGERAGRWSQTVAQVDESPRYSSLGRWEHTLSFSTWMSAPTWRPLPRRELSVRKDYQVLFGTNRVTITSTGALQEENNLKMVLAQNSEPDPNRPFLAREYGVARYERLRDFDFAAADHYFEATRQFWNDVHGAWIDYFQRNALVHESQNTAAGERLSDYADQIAGGQPAAIPAQQMIRDALRDSIRSDHP